MKKFFTLLVLAAGFMLAVPSQAQVKFGLKGGLNVTSMSFSSDVVSKSNQTGFFVGPTVKFTLPLVGLGIDAAALYDQRDAKLNGDESEGSLKVSQRSINIPINLRYSIGLGSIAGIYFAAGPQFGFNVGDDDFKWNESASYSLKKTNFSVNLGAGVSLVRHLEIGFNYNIACGKTGEANVWNSVTSAWNQVGKGRTDAWQVSAAYYF